MVALAVNTLQAVEGAQAAVSATYPLLADPDHQVAAAYGVYNLMGDGLASPAVFIIGTDRRVLWSYVGRDAADRPTVAEIVAHLP